MINVAASSPIGIFPALYELRGDLQDKTTVVKSDVY
jgi:hypothetical protein